MNIICTIAKKRFVNLTYCEKCGANNKDDSTFCSSCGTRLDFESNLDENRTLLDSAIKDKRWEDVLKYFSEIDFIDRDDYKSIFYIELAEYQIGDINTLDEGHCLINAFDETIDVLKKNNNNEIGSIIVDYCDEIHDLVKSLKSKANDSNLPRSGIESHPYFIPYEIIRTKKPFLSNLILCLNLLTGIINYYHEYSEEMENDEKLKKENFDFTSNLLSFLKEKNSLLAIINYNTKYEDSRFVEMEKTTTNEIKGYDLSYENDNYCDCNDINNCEDFCVNCGEELSEDDKFCPKCGQDFSEILEMDIDDDDLFDDDNDETSDKKDLETFLMIIIFIIAIALFIYFAP